MAASLPVVAQSEAELLGEVHALAAQLGRADDLASLAPPPLSVARIDTVPALEEFLQRYQTEVLFPHELPAILHAFEHANRFEVRELIALDQRLVREIVSPELARASERAGRSQLKRLRPLHDVRLVQRYHAAVTEGVAHGWHTLVFGVALQVYSLPVRQGLAAYARQTLAGFISAAGDRLRLEEADVAGLLSERESSVPAAIKRIVATSQLSAPRGLSVV